MDILRLSRPFHLVILTLTYVLGAGIAHYLGEVIKWAVFLLGLLVLLTIQITAFLLVEYFSRQFQLLAPGETLLRHEQRRIHFLMIIFTVLTISAVIMVLLLFLGGLSLQSGILLVLAILLLVAYAVPPLHLSEIGYGEFTLVVILFVLTPGFSFFLQAQEFHPLLPLTVFPLTLPGIAWQLGSNFTSYAEDLRIDRQSLLTRLTWQQAVPLHHILLLTGFLAFAMIPLFGVSWRLVWPVFLSLPFAAIEIAWLQRIANGGRPLWKFFNFLLPTVPGFSVYLLAISFWLR